MITLLALLAGLSAGPLSAQEFEGKTLVQPELVADTSHAVPGENFLVGVKFTIDPEWHIYWKYPGDSGMPTNVEWQAPEGVEVKELTWPMPHVYESAGYYTYAFSNELMLLYRVAVPEGFDQQELSLGADISWLVCRESCIPGDAQLTLNLPVGTPDQATPAHSELFLKWQERQPQRAGMEALPFEDFTWSKQADSDSFQLEITGVDTEQFPGDAQFYPLPPEEVTIGHPKTELDREAGKITVTVPVIFGLDQADEIPGVLVAEAEDGTQRQGWFVEKLGGTSYGGEAMEIDGATLSGAPMDTEPGTGSGTGTETQTGDEPQSTPATEDAGAADQPAESTAPTAANAAATPAQAGAPDSAVNDTAAAEAEIVPQETQGAATESRGLFMLLVLAFLGGIILNVMPCVLPAISLKVFGFIEQAQEDPRRIFLHGLSFSAGILLFFLLIGLLAVLITAGGGLFTWGSQFQDPLFVLFISTVVFVFALNMFGIFEIQLPSFLQTKASAAAGGTGYAGSFFHGLLATLLATACTAPFMGTALTGTLGQPAYVTLLVFFFLGLGMSAPYLLLAARPNWLKHIPKPGTWMEMAKQFMGFLLLATVIWLLNVFAKITSIEATMWFLASLLGIGVAAWLWGVVRPHYNGLPRVLISSTAAFILVLTCGVLITKDVTAETAKPAVDRDLQVLVESPALTEGGEINWQKWSPEAVDAAMESDRPVFIDFTADWCVNCQTNKRLVLNTEPVEQAFAQHNVLALKADWTRKDDQIKAAIHSYDRVGIPLNVVYYPDHPQRPLVLPEILTKGLVLNALEPLGEGAPAPGSLASGVAPQEPASDSPRPAGSTAGN